MGELRRMDQDKSWTETMTDQFKKFVQDGKLSGYEEPEFNGSARLNKDGAEALEGKEGDSWISFVYQDKNSSSGETESFYGVINPTTGDVNSTEALVWWN